MVRQVQTDQVEIMTRSALGAGDTFDVSHMQATRFFRARVAGTGNVSATVKVYGSDGGPGGELLATFTLSGSGFASDSFISVAPWPFVYADLTAVSGVGATVTVVMGS